MTNYLSIIHAQYGNCWIAIVLTCQLMKAQKYKMLGAMCSRKCIKQRSDHPLICVYWVNTLVNIAPSSGVYQVTKNVTN